MKKLATIFISIFLVLALCLTVTGCDFFGPNIIEDDDDPNNNGNQDEDENNEDEDEDEEDNANPYIDIINSLLGSIGDLDSMDEYIQAVSFILRNIPIENVKDQAQELLGSEYAEIIDTYFDKGLEMMDLAAEILPVLPTILDILEIINQFPQGSTSEALLVAALQKMGVTKNGNTYSFTYEDTLYTVQIDDENTNLYTVSFDDTTLIIEIIGQESSDNLNHIKVTENNVVYEMEFDEAKTSLLFDAKDITDTENPAQKYLFESINIGNDFAFQFFDSEGGTLVQLKTEIELLEATLSIQEEITKLPYSILDSVPTSFATEGEIYLINEGLLDEYL